MVELDLEDHSTVLGTTGSGKTTWFLKRVWQNPRVHKRVVFLNTQGDRRFGRPVHKWSAALVAPQGARVNLVPPRLSARTGYKRALQDFLAPVVDDLFELGARHARNREGLVVLAADEAHLISPKGSPDDPLQRVATNGHHHGVKGAFLTQRPALLSHTLLTQSETYVVFRVTPFEARYLEGYGVPADALEWAAAPPPGKPPGTASYRFIVGRGGVWTRCAPAP